MAKNGIVMIRINRQWQWQFCAAVIAMVLYHANYAYRELQLQWSCDICLIPDRDLHDSS